MEGLKVGPNPYFSPSASTRPSDSAGGVIPKSQLAVGAKSTTRVGVA